MTLKTLLIAVSSIALIIFAGFIGVRLARSRNVGLSIRMQFFLALSGIVGAFAVGLGLLVLERVKARTQVLAEESGRSEALAIAALVRNGMEQKGQDLGDVAAELSLLRDDLHLSLIDRDGSVVLSKGPVDDDEGTVTVEVPIFVHQEEVGRVRVVKPTLVIQKALADLTPTILVILLVLGSTAAIAAAIIGQTIATPIEKLTDFAVRVSEGQLLAAAPPAQGREVIRLVRAIETMRRELEGRPFVETFAADLSHELKNPVAAIRASAEVLADGALDEPEEARRFVTRIQEATGRIELLLGDLLSLAKIEARGIEDRTEVNLGDLLGKIAQKAGERGSKIALEITAPPASVRGDSLWLTRLFENLIDNAIIHGHGGAVQILLTREGRTIRCTIDNEGEVAGHVRKKLWKRFVTTRPERGGTGLGLAIARSVVEAHGGTIRCSAFGPPRVMFSVELPGLQSDR